MNNTISAVVLTHNDENKIVDCLEALRFCDEIIIIDDDSQDRTVELASLYSKTIKKHPLAMNFASQRNFALNYTHSEWILYVDSDEVVSKELSKEIVNKINHSQAKGFFLKRIDRMWGKTIKHGEVGSVSLLRLARKDSGKWKGRIHERWIVAGNTEELVNPLIHYPHQSVREFVKDIDEYTTIRAEELHDKGDTVTAYKIVLYPIGKFLQNYILKKGYKDEVPGFLYAMMMSLHSFLVRAKLYRLNSKQ